MWRFLAAAVVVGGAICLGGILNSRPIHQKAMANQPTVVRVYQDSLDPATERPATLSYQPTPAPNSVFKTPSADTSASSEEMVPTLANRFDRGRLDEEFDGEPVRSLPLTSVEADVSAIPASETSDEIGTTEVAQSEPDLFAEGVTQERPLPHPGSPSDHTFPGAPSRPTRLLGRVDADKVRPGFSEDASTKPQVRSSRVTIIRTPDHQIRIIAEDKSAVETPQPLAAGVIAITAEEFSLTPSTEAGVGNLLNCSGRVEIRGENFRARGAKLSIKNVDLLLEGTSVQPAEINKLPPAVANADAAWAETPEFHLAAPQIGFSLSLDNIKVSTAISILPVRANPATPVPPSNESRGSDAEEPPAVKLPAVPNVPEAQPVVNGA